ncbi:uncharacterized protein LOC110266911 [Arachis ipaensis]|uniref:uncharacterized protein LOC110266911 n=1 Tax=Arachis ipaensis TaxID=130454 RepID=UPI000A2B631B|nr:uncharacterized protein LOC110266911 [Arachis ipaensis]XP_025680007.1 uncharacterized protein LOC112779868 [Arachis hypogaea]
MKYHRAPCRCCRTDSFEKRECHEPGTTRGRRGVVEPSRSVARHHRHLTAIAIETERRRSSCRNLGVRPVIEEDRDEGGAVNTPWWLPSPLPRFLWSKSPLMEKTPLRSRASISRQSRRSYYGCCYLAATEGPSPPIHAAAEDELCLLLLPIRFKSFVLLQPSSLP